VKQLFLQEESVHPSLPGVVPSIYPLRVFLQVPSGCCSKQPPPSSLLRKNLPPLQHQPMPVLDLYPEQLTHTLPWLPLSPGLEGAIHPWRPQHMVPGCRPP